MARGGVLTRLSPSRLAAFLALAALAQDAAAGNILRAPAGAPPRSAPALTVNQAQAAAQAAATARQARHGLRQALDAIRAFQDAQLAARQAAQAAPTGVLDGLDLPGRPGGLVVLEGGTWLGAEAPREQAKDGRLEVEIAQTAPRAVLTWARFDVGRGTDLIFDQSAGGPDAAGWVALNRVLDPAGRPSAILGSIRAPGQVYVLNRNGILFGGTAQVNVGGLLASGLEIAGGGEAAANDTFAKAALAGLSFERASWGAAGQGDLAHGVRVEAGAALTSGDRGRIVLLGGTVENAGTLSAPEGQVFLAAGRRIDLLAPSPADLSAVRGLRGPDDQLAWDGAAGQFTFVTPLAELDGSVTNRGVLSARRGDVTMLGGETNQLGLATATTGAEAAGSIHLGQIGLRTTLGPGSVTQVLPDLDENVKLLGDGETFRRSEIKVRGARIDVLEDATVYVPAGVLGLRAYTAAAERPANLDPTVLDDTRVYLAAGARLDVSGLQGVGVDMETNSLRAELRANELRDNPLLRDGPLRSRAVSFDARLGGKLVDGTGVADLSGYYDLRQRSVSELMTDGGQLTVAANQVVTRAGSTIDLSGGSLRYRDGYVRRTVLVDGAGRRVPIEEAVKGVRYVGTVDDFVVDHPRWGVTTTFAPVLGRARPRFEAGYLQGGSAGSLTLEVARPAWLERALGEGLADPAVRPTAAVRVLEGDLLAATIIGPRQRELATGATSPTRIWRERPRGGALTLTGAGDVTIGAAPEPLPAGFGPGDPVDAARHFDHRLPASLLDGSGLASITIESGYDPSVPPELAANRAPGGHLVVEAGAVVDLGDAGAFTFGGKSARLDGTLRAPGGSVRLTALDQGGDLARAVTIEVGSTGAIDVAGRFTNDALDGALGPPGAATGGTISLSAGAIALRPGSRLDVSGGGRLDAAGARLTPGNAGAISLDVTGFPRPDPAVLGDSGVLPPEPRLGRLVLEGALDGHALGTGGALTLQTGLAVRIGGAPVAEEAALVLDPAFFGRDGFASYAITGERGVTVDGDLRPTVESFAPRGLRELASGTRLADALGYQRVLDQDGLGRPMRLTLSTGTRGYSATSPAVELAAGAGLRLAPGSTVILSSTDAVILREGATIETPGGTVSLFASGVSGDGGITLESGARVLVPGRLRSALEAGVLVRSVVAGGTITLAGGAAGGGAKRLLVDQGAVLDASGVAGVADLPAPAAEAFEGATTRYRPVEVAGDAGAITIAADQGLLAGDLRLAPGARGAAEAAGRGGTLLVSGTRGRIDLGESAPPTLEAGVLRAVAGRLGDADADDLTLRVADPAGGTGSFSPAFAIRFDGDVDLWARRSLILEAPVLGTVAGKAGAVTLRAGDEALPGSGHVALIGGNLSAERSVVSASGPEVVTSLEVRAGVIDVARSVVLGSVEVAGGVAAFGGFARARLDAGTGDIRLSDHDPFGRDAARPGEPVGRESTLPGLLAAGELELRAGQVYVVSRARAAASTLSLLERPEAHPGFLVRSSARITVSPPGVPGWEPGPAPLSFGERLTLRAPAIAQGGVLRAPAGQIRLEGQDGTGAATGEVTLLPGSLTSVALIGGDGTGLVVPFGSVQSDGTFSGYQVPGAAPRPSIKLGGARLDVAEGATVDVRGGGDLLGHVFVAGNGGSADVLGAIADASGRLTSAPGLGPGQAAPFAILPSLGGAPAPIGPVDSLRDPRLKVGDQVHLQGVPGLADGTYTLLPAHYALLPGGRLVQPLGGGLASAPDSALRPDGAVVAAGYGLVAGERRDAGWSRYVVMGQETFGAYGQLESLSFDAYARRTAAEAGVTVRTLVDGGAVVLSAPGSLGLAGAGLFGAAPGGLAGTLDIAADRIAVATPDRAVGYAGYVVLDPAALGAFGAGSLLLGGTRSASLDATAPGTVIRTAASEVVVDTGGAALAAPELILAGTSRVVVADGAVLTAAGGGAGEGADLRLGGSGALLLVSAGGVGSIVRSGGAAGELVIGDASLRAAGALGLDAGGKVTLGREAELEGTSLQLSSTIVNLGDAPTGSEGTIVSSAQLARLGAATRLAIRGQQAIRLHGDLSIGAGADSGVTFTLDSPSLEGVGGGTARIAAGELVLRNGGAAAPVGVDPGGPGALELDVERLVLGPGEVRVAGYDRVTGRAGVIRLDGSGGLVLAGALGEPGDGFATARVEAAAGVSYALTAAGAAALRSEAPAGSLPEPEGLGARLRITAASLSLDTSVLLPSGSFEATATAGPLALGASGRIDVSGRALDFFDQPRFAPAGSIRLGAHGDLSTAAGSVLDLSGTARGGEAGALALTALGGQVSLAGDLRATSQEGWRGASLAVDASALDLATLNPLLEAAGFTEARTLRVRGAGQDLRLTAGARISAHDVTLRADQGQVVVAGQIGLPGDAAHAAGGRIELSGGAGVELTASGRVEARAAAATVDGYVPGSGRVLLASEGGAVAVRGGAIDLRGGRGGGSLVVRAARTAGGARVEALDGTFDGATERVVQGLASYDATVVDAALVQRLAGDSAAWLAAARAAPPPGTGGFEYAPAVLVRSGGDLAVVADVSLARPDAAGQVVAGGPGWLGLAAAGDLDVGASLSDGFADATPGAALLAGRSASLDLEAGGDLLLRRNTLVRSGTGDLSARAGGDLILEGKAAAADRAAALYTAGQKAPWADGFTSAGVPATAVLGEFATGGGDVDLQAGGDVLAPLATQATSAWLYRWGATAWAGKGSVDTATVRQQASWSVVHGRFDQGIGALGGGDVRVRAGGDVARLQVSIPTTGQVTTALGRTPAPGDLVLRGGGDLEVTAGGDLRGGLYLLGRGHGELRAGGAVRPDEAQLASVRRRYDGQADRGAPRALGLLLGLGDATLRVTAGASALVEGAYDPMRQGQVAGNLVGLTGTAFGGYADRTSLEVVSLGGSTTYLNDPWAAVDLATSPTSAPADAVAMTGSGGLNLLLGRAPPSLALTSFGQDVVVASGLAVPESLRLDPAARGTLALLARRDLWVRLNVDQAATAPAYVRDWRAVLTTTRNLDLGAAGLDDGLPLDDANGGLGAVPLHRGDPDPARLYALEGSVCAQRSGCGRGPPPESRPGGGGGQVFAAAIPTVSTATPLHVRAGRDLLSGDYRPQGNGPDDLSLFEAGRDVYQPVVQALGEGAAFVVAGRDVLLAEGEVKTGSGVEPPLSGGTLASLGNAPAPGTVNGVLPRDRGTELVVMAGQRPGRADFDAFAAAYLDPAGQAQRAVRDYFPALRAFVGRFRPDAAALDEAALVAAFASLPGLQRERFLLGVYFTELKETGIDYNDPDSARFQSYDRGFAALRTLFPTDPASLAAGEGGSVLLHGKRVETNAAAGITLLAPYGRIEIGTEAAQARVDSSRGGVVTRRGGDIRIMADQNVDLVAARVFTLQGGDITMWTSAGSITAGSGSKTSVFQKPLAYAMTADGVVQVDAFGLQTGAGIGVLDALEDKASRPPSRLDLIAPRGEVNAGDAGIRVAGNLNIAAAVVVGMDNIQVSGAAQGIPTVVTPSVGALTAATSAVESSAKEAGVAGGGGATRAEDLPSIITVEVVGYETTDEDDGAPSKKKRKR